LVPVEALKDKGEEFDSPVSAEEVMKKIEDKSYRGRITRLYISLLVEEDLTKKIAIWDEMVLIKRTSKKAWENYAIPGSVVKTMTKLKEDVSFKHGANVPAPSKPTPALNPIVPVAPLSPENESYSQRIKKLASITPMDSKTAEIILGIKKQSKKGWAALKVSDDIVSVVLKLTSK